MISPDEFGYIDNPEIYHLYPYTGEALRILKQLDYKLFVVTNQSGVARGYFSEAQLQKVLDKMRQLILDEGVALDGVYYSPYFATGIVPPYNVQHEDRKPGIGMYQKARQEHDFDPHATWMIGDRATDVHFGQNAGIKTILLLSGNGTREFTEGVIPGSLKPNFVCENLLTAAKLIQAYY